MKYWRYSAKKEPGRLQERLRKYIDPRTPEAVKENGELWGKGQVEISTSRNEVWRGQVRRCTSRITEQGLELQVHLYWFAKKSITRKAVNFLKIPWTVVVIEEWVALYSPYKTEFVISTFWQDKTRIRKGTRHPKRLFFKTATNESGFFARRDDPENVRIKHGGVFDPVLGRRFEFKKKPTI